MPNGSDDPRVAILLSTFNGEAFLPEQLNSFLAQSHDNWVLYWRDDGSTDGTCAVIAAFAARAGYDRCVQVAGEAERLGPAGSFMRLLRSVTGLLGDHDVVAFADQDDVWLPEKLSRGLAALGEARNGLPVLYCARQFLVDATLQPLGISTEICGRAGFPGALTQNVATGCTVMLNRTAALLVARSRPSAGSLHDWWSYLMVTAAGGYVVRDDHPVVLYRQHGGNLVGAPRSRRRRAMAALKRGPGAFMSVLRQNVAALAAQPDLLTEQARRDVAAVPRALNGGVRRRLMALRMPGQVRQTWSQTMVFRCWFLIG
jgi:glycosyltransferase involved in cell wall biosynthesis